MAEQTTTGQDRKVIRMPIKQVELKLDEIGYAGWVAVLRTNPRAEYYDMFLSSDEKESWRGFGHLIVNWNFGDEDGNAIPLPSIKDGDGGSEQTALPYDVQSYLVRHYVDAFNEAAGLPKRPSDNSSNTSPIEGESPLTVVK